jgi:hypothetical protein
MTFHRFLGVALGAALIVSGCDGAGSERLLAPSANLSVDSGISKAAVAKTRRANAPNTNVVLVYPAAGGSVSVDGHTLSVPPGAVTQPTFFMLQIVEANAIHVKLKAWRASDAAPVSQFPNVPVELTLDVSDLETLDLSGLVVVYLRDGTYSGAKEPVPTVVSGSTRITGYLTHFSQYAVAFAREYSAGID